MLKSPGFLKNQIEIFRTVPAFQAGCQCFICQVGHVFFEPLVIQSRNRFKMPDFSSGE